MTKKDYEKIASVLSLGKIECAAHFAQEPGEAWAYMVGARAQWLELVYRVCAVMADDNPRFDRARFLKACGIE